VRPDDPEWVFPRGEELDPSTSSIELAEVLRNEHPVVDDRLAARRFNRAIPIAPKLFNESFELTHGAPRSYSDETLICTRRVRSPFEVDGGDFGRARDDASRRLRGFGDRETSGPAQA